MFDAEPQDWREASFASLADYANGRAFKPEDWGESGLPIIRIAQITNPGSETDFYDGVVEPRHLLEDGDLIFSWSATLAVMRWARGPAVLNQHLFKVTPVSGIDRDWLQYRLEASIPDLADEAHGTTMKHIRKGTLASKTTRVPPLDEQQRIAEVLRSVDETIGAGRAAVAAALRVFRDTRDELLQQARDEFPDIAVADALAKNRGEKLRKLQTSAYLDVGKHPIIDQGADFICGYTDDDNALWPYALPVIVFGDHTRALKFVDFPFVIGADGTQCLTAKEGVLPRYLYFAIQSLDLRSEGYARHFKLLKEQTIPLPDEDTQREIVEALVALERAHELATQSVERAENVKKAVASDLLSGRVRVAA